MGFIEDERKRKAIEQADQERFGDILKQQKSELEQADISRRAARKSQWEKARQQFEQSGLGEMVRELGKIGSHKFLNESNEWHIGPGNSHIVSILIGSEWPGVGRGGWRDKKVEIEVTPDGLIKVKGGLFGSTTLSKDKWREENGREALDKALGKAYKHPKISPAPTEDNSVVGDHPGN